MKTRGRLAAWEGKGGCVPGAHPCHHPYGEPAALACLALGAWFSPQPEGWAGQTRGGGHSWRGSGASGSKCPPPTPQACLLRPQSAVCPGAGGGEKTQIRHRPGGLEPGCGLVLGVRRRELKPDGCLWLALSREAARPCCTTGPSFRLGLHPQHALLGDL